MVWYGRGYNIQAAEEVWYGMARGTIFRQPSRYGNDLDFHQRFIGTQFLQINKLNKIILTGYQKNSPESFRLWSVRLMRP